MIRLLWNLIDRRHDAWIYARRESLRNPSGFQPFAGPVMIRFFFKLVLCLLLALAAGFAYLALQSGDPVYTVYEWISPARFQQYDRLIRAVAAEHHLDPMLVKAVVWRESRFDPQKYGSARERRVMPGSEKAANAWARETKISKFHMEGRF